MDALDKLRADVMGSYRELSAALGEPERTDLTHPVPGMGYSHLGLGSPLGLPGASGASYGYGTGGALSYGRTHQALPGPLYCSSSSSAGMGGMSPRGYYSGHVSTAACGREGVRVIWGERGEEINVLEVVRHNVVNRRGTRARVHVHVLALEPSSVRPQTSMISARPQASMMSASFLRCCA